MSNEKDRLRMAMGEVASLPPEDPLRQQIEADISRQGEWAEKEWLELLNQDEHFRIALRKVDAPPNLEKYLLEIPDESTQSKKVFMFKRWRFASVALIVIGIIASIFLIQKKDSESVLQTIATLAINDHLNNRHLEVITNNASELKAKLAGLVPFEVVIPEFKQNFNLMGGRPCKLGHSPIIYTLWQTSQCQYSLFQLKLSDFDLASIQWIQRVKPKDYIMAKSPCEVLSWSQGEFGFILVADHGDLLDVIFIEDSKIK